MKARNAIAAMVPVVYTLLTASLLSVAPNMMGLVGLKDTLTFRGFLANEL